MNAVASQKVQVELVHDSISKRYYYNRFHVEHTDIGVVVSVWYEDSLRRNSNCYVFIMESEDWRCCEPSMKSYVQKYIQSNGFVIGVLAETSWSPASARIENYRTISCSRMDDRAEIYLGNFYIHGVLGQNVTKGIVEVALCSNVACHIKLIQKIIEVMG